MAKGFAELDAMIARVDGLRDFVRDAAPEVADACRSELERTIKAGTTPDGREWEPKKEGTGKPLANAANALAVVPVGKTVFMTLQGPEARHHRGTAKGGTMRQVLPVSEVPGPMAKAIRRVLVKRFREAMGGA